jgi:hypothetical protein
MLYDLPPPPVWAASGGPVVSSDSPVTPDQNGSFNPCTRPPRLTHQIRWYFHAHQRSFSRTIGPAR